MDLARMPPPDTAQLSRAQATVLNHLLDGMDAPTLARKLARGNRAKAKQYRQRFRRWMAEDTVFAAALASGTRAELQLASPSMAQALIKRGQRGRVDAIKLVWEAGTFHNPRVDHSHEHSGEVTIKLESVGRPAPVLDEAIVDADVVE